MIKLAILKPKFCYGPEIYALYKYLSEFYSLQVFCEILDYDEFLKRQNNFDLVYKMMGFSPLIFNGIKIPEIHDYASLSTGKCMFLKNSMKSHFQKKPVYRTFLNKHVYGEFNFNDNVPYGLRDMAVDNSFYDYYDFDYEAKEYDFCYVGEISKERGMDKFINFFENSNFKVLMIGDNKLGASNSKNINFSGRVENSIVPNLINKCRFAINFVPNLYPYNLQTSTKLLEYLSMGIPVISNKYKWVEDYVGNNNISLLFFNDFTFFNKNFKESYNQLKKINQGIYIKKWSEVFESSGLIDFILNYNGK